MSFQHHPDFRKGLSDWDELQDALQWAVAASQERQAFIETDMRAFANPTRMLVIRQAAQALVKAVGTLPGLRCSGFCQISGDSRIALRDMRTPTEIAKADIHQCLRCEYQILVDQERHFAAAANCGYGNP